MLKTLSVKKSLKNQLNCNKRSAKIKRAALFLDNLLLFQNFFKTSFCPWQPVFFVYLLYRLAKRLVHDTAPL